MKHTTLLLAALLMSCSGAKDDTAADAAASASDARANPDAAASASDAGATTDAAPSPASIVINEFCKNPPGPDYHEFIELRGQPDTDYSDLTVLVIEADLGGGPGTIEHGFAVGMTDASGYWTTGFLQTTIANGGSTIVLVRGFTGTVGDDLDAGDDGIFDTTPWAEILDDVAQIDDADGVAYSSVILASGFGDVPEEYNGIARYPDGVDTDSVADWVPHDEGGNGLQGVTGAGGNLCDDCGVEPPESGAALITHGATNQIAP